MNHNKRSLEISIKALEASVKMEADIREVMKTMKHHKYVNKKFTDAITEKGYWAYIIKDKYSKKLVVSCNQHGIDVYDREDFTIYLSTIGENQNITWELIEQELVRHAFKERLSKAFEQLKFFEIEREQLRRLCEFMDKIEFKCFDMYDIKRKLKQILEYANKETV